MPYKDPERQREYAREWLKKNAQKARDAVRRWRLAHPERHNAKNRLYNARHRDERNAYMAVYNREHHEVVLAKWHNYRARKRAAAGSFTSAEWLALVTSYQGRCAYCGETKPLEPEHRTPLSRGGSNAIDNIAPACHGCNARKHRMTEAEFRARIASERPDDLESA
ncbi:MAG: HNH endonuclease [Gemmatimonadota bacterium]|nr:HNH endonuclease [Gemmatimonadota bacterium]